MADEDDRRETLYICRGTAIGGCGVTLCSHLGPKGRLAALPVGGYARIPLPGGPKAYEVVERTLIKPSRIPAGWDARDTVVQTERFGPLTVASLRDLLAKAGWSEDELDLLDRQLAEDEQAANITEGVKRAVLTAMQLRDQPILDQFQDEIFRLPLESRLAILRPAGTGKTTTLICRLRQKIDVEHLSEDEKDSIGQAAGGLPHAQSWLMFTPTELLKRYVREAFQREDVAAPDSRLRTWDEHRRELARRALPILRSAAGGTLVMDERLEPLQPDALHDQIGWFEDFDKHQRDAFFTRLADAAATIARGEGAAAQELGADLQALFDHAGARPGVTMTALVERFDRLRGLANALGDEVGQQLRRPLAIHLRRDPGVLDDLARLLGSLGADDEIEDEADDGEEDGEEDEAALPPGSKRAAQAAYLRALRAAAVAQARGRSVPVRGRTAAVLAWLTERGVALPDLARIGAQLVVQRAARRLLGAANRFIRGVPGRYRQFRPQRAIEGRWYLPDAAVARGVAPLEVDVVLLSLLRAAATVSNDSLLMRRLGERAPAILADVARLQRNQILVDEAPTSRRSSSRVCARSPTRGPTHSSFAATSTSG